MTIRAAFAVGTAASVAVTAAWAWTATLTIGTPPVLHLSLHDLPGDYVQLAGAATGSSGLVLFAVVAVIFALCFFTAGLLGRRKAQREAAQDAGYSEDEAAVSGGRSR